MPLWRESGYGVQLHDSVYSHCVWADNVWLFSHDAATTQRMAASFTSMLAEHRLFWKPSSLQVMSSIPQNAQSFDLNDGCHTMSVQPVESMEILGNIVDRSGNANTLVEHRLVKAMSAFWAQKALYCDKTSSLAKRFERYSSQVVPRAIHGCGGWSWSQSLCQRLHAWEGRNLRRILSSNRRPGEEYIAWIRRTTQHARRLYARMGYLAMTHRVLHGIHKLAGELRFSNSE